MEIPEFKPKLVKSGLVERVYKRVGFTRQEAEEAVDVLFKKIKTELANGESVRIAGFASFYLKNKEARITRNPQTGETIVIRSRRVLAFKPSKQLLISTDSPINNAGNRCFNVTKNKLQEVANAFDSLHVLKNSELSGAGNFNKLSFARKTLDLKLPEIMTEFQVIEWLQLNNVRQLRYLCSQKGFPYLPINKRSKRFDRNEIVTWMKKNRRMA